MAHVSSTFAEEVRNAKEFNASACMNCGCCTAVCPLGRAILPRKLFRYALLGLEDRVREQIPTVYSCLLCKMCEENCPADVKIAENIRFLRNKVNKEEFNLP